MKLSRCLALCVVLALVSVGCVHKSNGGTVTPMERVTTDNAVLAQLVGAIEQGTEALVTAGVLKPAEAAPVIAWCGNAAQIDLQLTAILGKGLPVSLKDYAALQALVAQVGTSASTLVSSGALAVKNPKTQQTVAADITAASTLAQGLLTEIQALTPTPTTTAPTGGGH